MSQPLLPRPVWHGQLLLACLPVCAVLQDWDTRTVGSFRRFLSTLPGLAPAGVDLLPPPTLRTALARLPKYCRRHHLDNTLLDDAHLTNELLQHATDAWERGW